MAWSLAVFCECCKRLVYKVHIEFIDVKTQQTKSSCRTATNTIKKL